MIFLLLSETVGNQLITSSTPRPIGSCEVCGRRAEIEKVKGYLFEMCPHCAYMTKIHANEKYADKS